MIKLHLEKAEEPEINLSYLLDHRKSKRVPEEHLLPHVFLCICDGFSLEKKPKSRIPRS